MKFFFIGVTILFSYVAIGVLVDFVFKKLDGDTDVDDSDFWFLLLWPIYLMAYIFFAPFFFGGFLLEKLLNGRKK